MLILDKYIIRNFIKSFLSCLIFFISLYIIIDVFSAISELLKNHPPLVKVFEYYAYSIPLIFTQTSPIATLLATLFTLGHFNQNNEIIAMRASGLSIYAIVRPIILFGFLLSLSIFMINENITPQTQKMSKYIRSNYIDRSPDNLVDRPIKNVAVYGFGNKLFFINKLYPKSNTIEGLTILEHDKDQNVTAKVYAEKAVWRNNRWVLYQCFIYHMSDEKQIKSEPLYFSDTTIKIEETPQDFMRQNIPVENMNAKELSSYIARLSESENSSVVKRLKVDLFQKTSFPFTSLIIILLGIPSSIVIQRRTVAFSSIGLCIGISFIFYVCFSVSLALGKAGAIPPFMAAWQSHVIFASAALYFISRIP
ncbi:MAG: LPS export ABC transporter permease LptG [Candidatus Omnitrophica bacterium CG1_02_44_16]|nr:MAG: LPS export ABC transporter permease LptG [Candidatus Omnitrophica bacterium CG1_02_44_16]PIY82930.1 MAG: LPS export ABC transporter permease LptG [Candidatus Omnitrophica bacterium CG_4_10_14_0_8_um_filter_44_12]PIZ84262.1 MAG: LPS export ABC transporter permease LptG [Candidatus Omnitrophica bacterium CG_4_10_14_0_2_um_filter_44_9]